MKSFVSSFLNFLRSFPLEILLQFVLIYIIFSPIQMGNANAFGWLPVIFVLVFSMNHLRSKGWWGTVLYVLAFLLWIPAIFLHYEDVDLEWTVLMANLIAFGVFLSAGKRVDSCEWASRALHRLVALFQACIILLVYILVWWFINLLKRPHLDNVAEYIFAGMLPVCGLVLCWRLWAKPKTSIARETFLKVMEWMLLAVNVLLIAMVYVISVLTIIKGSVVFNHQGYWLFASYLLLGLGMLVRDARGDCMTAWMVWFYRYLPLIALPMLALLWYSALIPVSWFGLSAPRIFLLLMTGMITIFQLITLIRRSLSLRVSTHAVILELALFTFIPGIRMEDIALRNQISRYKSALPIMEEKGVLASEASRTEAAKLS